MNDLNKKEGDQKSKNAECDDVIFITSLIELCDCLTFFLTLLCTFTLLIGCFYLASGNERYRVAFLIYGTINFIMFLLLITKQKSKKKLTVIEKIQAEKEEKAKNRNQDISR